MPITSTPPDHAQNLIDAVDQLERSERGRLAMRAFRKFIEADNRSVFSLDSENQHAIETLARSCRIFGAHTVHEFLTK